MSDKSDTIRLILELAERMGVTKDDLCEYLGIVGVEDEIPELLDVKKVADILDVHPMTVKTYIKDGHLKAIMTLRKYLVRKTDLLEFINRNDENEEDEA